MPDSIQITSWGPQMNGGPGSLASITDPADVPQGQELLTRLRSENPGMAGAVQSVLEGRSAYPAGFFQKTPLGQQIMQYANLIDPTLDSTSYPARVAQRKNYMGGGKQFQEMQAIGTVAGHLQNLAKSAGDLDNFDGLGPLNYPANYLRSTLRGLEQDPKLTVFNTDKQAVMTELGKAYRGGTLTEGELNKWMDTLSSMSTPSQVRSVIGELNSLLASKRQALEEGYQQTMGHAAALPQDFSAQSARNKQIFDNIDAWSRSNGPYKALTEGGAANEGARGGPAERPAPSPGFYVYDPATKTLKQAR